MKTMDLRKDLKYLYNPSARNVEAVQVPRLQFVIINGRIEQGAEPSSSPSLQESIAALYAMAYTLKFMFKKRPKNAIDYPVMALEGLWWVEDGSFDLQKKDNWFFTLQILEPDIVNQDSFEAALSELRRKRGDNPSFNKLQLATYEEGLCMQVMHIGPYAEEPKTVELMELFARQNGYVDLVGRGGKHHEIYLGDPRKADPTKLKTVLRHPIQKA